MNANESSESIVTLGEQMNEKVRRFIDLCESGLTDEEASKEVGVSLNSLKRRQPVIKYIRTRLEEYGGIPGNVTAELVRAERLRLLVEGDDKTKLAVMAQIQTDPNTGLTKETPTVNIDLGSLADVFTKLDK